MPRVARRLGHTDDVAVLAPSRTRLSRTIFNLNEKISSINRDVLRRRGRVFINRPSGTRQVFFGEFFSPRSSRLVLKILQKRVTFQGGGSSFGLGMDRHVAPSVETISYYHG